MFKTKVKKIAALTLSLVILIGSTAFAKPTSNEGDSIKSEKKLDQRNHKKGPRKCNKLSSIKELGLTEEEISNARNSGKTLFDLAKEKKGLTPEQVRAILIKAKTDAINKKVEEGKITKERANEIIPKMKSRIENWDGNLKPHNLSKNPKLKTN